jgi:manganese-dependent inorganic pyrophosphatase
MNSIVCSYTNPDLDGVACGVALETLHVGLWKARISGKVDAETALVLGALGINIPPPIVAWDGIDEIWLVDTHHLMQLPKGLPTALVVKITDHHPGGDPSSFPNAAIQNESVGAAATLIAEQYELRKAEIPRVIAVLLQAAILSNTLELRSRSTSARDEQMYSKLKSIQPIDSKLVDGMRERRRGVLDLSSELLVRHDNKRFETRFGNIPWSAESMGTFRFREFS